MAFITTVITCIIHLIIAGLISWMVDTVQDGSGLSTFITYILTVWVYFTYKGYSVLVQLMTNRDEYLKQLDEVLKGDKF